MGTPIKWTGEMDALLGTMSDYDVADELDMCQMSSCRRRNKLGVTAFQPKTDWTPEMDSLLGTKSDQKICTELGINRWPVRRRRGELNIPSWKAQNRILPEALTRYDPEANRIFVARRTHRKLDLPDTLTWEEWQLALRSFNHRCAYCSEEANLTEDHLRPLSRGGGRTALNILPVCSSCNSSKGPKTASTWIYWRFGREGQEIIDRIVAYLTEVKSRQI